LGKIICSGAFALTAKYGAKKKRVVPPPARLRTILHKQNQSYRVFSPAIPILKSSNKGRTLPPPYIVFRNRRLKGAIKIPLQKICQQQKIKTKDPLQPHLTVCSKNSYVCICRFNSRNRQIAHFNSTLPFINTDYAQPAYFYIFNARKVLEDRGICLMFTKNNIAANKMNNKNHKNAISCI
jgi:hypothetical protein